MVTRKAMTGWQPTMAVASWKIKYSPQQPAHPVNVAQGWQVSIPVNVGPFPCKSDQNAKCPALHYVMVPVSSPLTGAKGLRMTGQVVLSGDPTFGWRTEPSNQGTSPASVRLWFQRKGDNLSGSGAYQYYRWWSNPAAVQLQPGGALDLTVNLDPALWSSVLGRFGTASPADFAKALAKVGNVGMTFGGGSFFGHGVYIDKGSAAFNCQGFTVGW